jgi:hypothetical protein
MLPRSGVLALALLALPAQAEASEALWALLKSGGQAVIMRHAATDSTAGDRDTMRLEDCSTQRNLSPLGRDTATLAFGMANPWLPLNSFFRNRDREPGQTGAARELVVRHRGGTLVLVTHQVSIAARTGLYPAEGEMIILTPRGGDFTVGGRLKPPDVTQN